MVPSVGPSSVVGRLPLKPPDRTPAPQLVPLSPRVDVEQYPRIGQESGRVQYGLAVGSSVEIDLADLEGDEARDLLVSEESADDPFDWCDALASDDSVAEDDLDELLAMAGAHPERYTIKPKRTWLRRMFALAVFVAAFWLAHAQLSPWLD